MFIWKPVPGHVLNDMCFLKENYLFLIKCMLHVWKELSFSSRNPHPLNKECLLKTNLVRSLQTVRKLFFPFSFGFCFFSPSLGGNSLMTHDYLGWVCLCRPRFSNCWWVLLFCMIFFRWDIVPWLIEIRLNVSQSDYAYHEGGVQHMRVIVYTVYIDIDTWICVEPFKGTSTYLFGPLIVHCMAFLCVSSIQLSLLRLIILTHTFAMLQGFLSPILPVEVARFCWQRDLFTVNILKRYDNLLIWQFPSWSGKFLLSNVQRNDFSPFLL